MNLTQNLVDKNLMMTAIEKSLAMILFTPEGTVLWANENFGKAMGYSIHEVVGIHHRSFCFPELANSKEYELFWGDLRKGIPFHNKVHRKTKAGETIWLEAFYTPVLDENGKTQAVVKIATDVTTAHTILHNSTNEFIAVVQEMTASTNEVYFASQTITADMEILNKESEVVKGNIKQIETIVTYVKQIATQSNLLGLNASIEASRVGQHGLGFAVVAKEIRKMAETSKKSADDITNQLNEIIQSVAIMMEKVEAVTNKIENNTNSIEELKKAYEHIAKTADELSKTI